MFLFLSFVIFPQIDVPFTDQPSEISLNDIDWDLINNEKIKGFQVSLEFTTVFFAMVIMSIDPLMSALLYVLYAFAFINKVNLRNKNLLEMTMQASLVQLLCVYLGSYLLVKQSKLQFITAKRLQLMMIEQRRIVTNLPDGVLISKEISS